MTRSAAVAALCATALACLYHPAPRPTTYEGEWARVRGRYSRSAKLYDGLTTRAFGQVIYDAPELRQARVDRLATWQSLTAEEKARLAASERATGEQWDEFLVPFFTAGWYLQVRMVDSTASSRTLPPDSTILASVTSPLSVTTKLTRTDTASPDLRRGAPSG